MHRLSSRHTSRDDIKSRLSRILDEDEAQEEDEQEHEASVDASADASADAGMERQTSLDIDEPHGCLSPVLDATSAHPHAFKRSSRVLSDFDFSRPLGIPNRSRTASESSAGNSVSSYGGLAKVLSQTSKSSRTQKAENVSPPDSPPGSPRRARTTSPSPLRTATVAAPASLTDLRVLRAEDDIRKVQAAHLSMLTSS